jgi:hypothetical protein
MYNGANATDEIEVHLTYAAPLKGSKEAYYPDGTEMMVCSRTLLPEGGYEPCWWVARHREVVERP